MANVNGEHGFNLGTDLVRLVDGAGFILDAPVTVPCLWGRGDEVVWAEGESLILVGPTGVGNTTLTGQIVRARLGLIATVLGYPVEPASARVLYLAMDRPAQIARSLHRHFHENERDVLTHRVRVWKGPPPSDLARHPETLVGLAHMAAADTVILDSLKDAALGLTEDEVGAAYNRARQHALTEGVQLVELHHMVKRGPGGARPTTLADVYGSVWLTAGAGSVVLLWGAAGDPRVEWHHLKQPAAEVGPFRVVHDHTVGISEIFRSLDLIDLARKSGPHGLSIKAAAQALFTTDKPDDNQIKKAQRRLDGLVPDHLTVHEVPRPTGGKPQRRYLPAGILFAVEQPREQSRQSSAGNNPEPFPPIPPDQEPAGQSNPASNPGNPALEQSRTPPSVGGGAQVPDDDISAHLSASTAAGRSTPTSTATSVRETQHDTQPGRAPRVLDQAPRRDQLGAWGVAAARG